MYVLTLSHTHIYLHTHAHTHTHTHTHIHTTHNTSKISHTLGKLLKMFQGLEEATQAIEEEGEVEVK